LTFARTLRFSRLGFGLSSIAGLGSRTAQERLVDVAFDSGITHFDVAPYYGMGDAEWVLGSFLRSRRNHITVATKVGLNFTLDHPSLRIFRQAARKAFKVFPRLKRKAVTAITRRGVEIHYTAEALHNSVHRSLNQLRTECIDLLLLHDWPAEAALQEPIAEAIQTLITKGTIRSAGVASSPDDAFQACTGRPSIFPVAQFENSLLRPAEQVIQRLPAHFVLTHRALSETNRATLQALASRPSLRALWTTELGLDPLEKGSLAILLIHRALTSNPNGTVLFSSTNALHVTAIAKNLDGSVISSDLLHRLESLFSDVRSSILALSINQGQ
jgi:D-threo-aldose 1-dehydrogenase